MLNAGLLQAVKKKIKNDGRLKTQSVLRLRARERTEVAAGNLGNASQQISAFCLLYTIYPVLTLHVLGHLQVGSTPNASSLTPCVRS